MEHTKQGILIIGANLLYTCPYGVKAKVTLRFTDMHPYAILLSKYDKSQNNTVNLWDLQLDAKDTVIDDANYHLEEDDYISVASNSSTTNYSLYIIELPI